MSESKHQIYQVIGNHDLYYRKVAEELNLRKAYYCFTRADWQFIFLNGNEITLQSADPGILQQANNYIWNLTNANMPNNKKWNGGVRFNGHNHAGNYIFHKGIHFVTLKGMVETKLENSFSEITFFDNQIDIKGFGRADSYFIEYSLKNRYVSPIFLSNCIRF